MYDEIGSHFSRTRQKTYGEGESTNWIVTDKYLKLLKSGESVLDIGCGNGKLVTGLPEGVSYLGTDFSQTLLGEARRLHPHHEFRFGDVIDPAYWASLGTYDALFCVAVLHHIPERSQQLFVLGEMKKHLEPGGFLYLSVWNLWQKKYLQYHVDGHVEVPYVQSTEKGKEEWIRYCVPYTIESLSDLLREAGWVIDETYYANRDGEPANIESSQNLVAVAK